MKNTANKILTLFRRTGLLLFMVATSFFSYAQVTPEDDEIDILLDELFFNEDQMIDDILASLNRYDFIYTSITFNSNSYFSGRDSGIDQFNFYPQASYYHSSGFNFSISGLYYETFDPNWDFTSLSLGYNHYLGKKKLLYLSTGYTRYFYSDGSGIFTNAVDLGLGIQNKKRTIGSTLSATYLFGTDNALQLISSTYGKITLAKKKTFSIKFKPRINFLIAQQTMALEELNSQTQEAEYINYDVFDLLNAQLNLPITFVSKSFNLDLGYMINFPNAVATETNLKSNGFFTINMGYMLSLKK